jgi:hypothetical protein
MCSQGKNDVMDVSKNDPTWLSSLLKKLPTILAIAFKDWTIRGKNRTKKSYAKLNQNLSRMPLPWSSFICMII